MGTLFLDLFIWQWGTLQIQRHSIRGHISCFPTRMARRIWRRFGSDWRQEQTSNLCPSELDARPLMKRCPYCGKEYSDEYSVCALDENPLESSAVKPRKSQRGVLAYILIPVLLVGFDFLIDPHFFSLKNIRVLFAVGLMVLVLLVWGVFWLQTKWLKRRLAKAMKEALEREAREGKTRDDKYDTTVA